MTQATREKNRFFRDGEAPSAPLLSVTSAREMPCGALCRGLVLLLILLLIRRGNVFVPVRNLHLDRLSLGSAVLAFRTGGAVRAALDTQDPKIMFGVLKESLGRYAISRGHGIPAQRLILVVYLLCRTADFAIRTTAFKALVSARMTFPVAA